MYTRSEETQRQIIKILRDAGKHLSAYDITAAMSASNPKIAPTTIYRVLAVLVDKGLVHRLESTNSYMACKHEGRHDAAILSICHSCGEVEESNAPGLIDEIANAASEIGFAPSKHVLEMHGVCSSCEPQKAAP